MYANLPAWKQSPFIRIIPPFILGIALHWYVSFSLPFIITGLLILLSLVFSFSYLPVHKQFRVRFIMGGAMLCLIFSFGMLISYMGNIQNETNWYGHHLKKGERFLLRLSEHPVEKNKSWKCVAETEAIFGKHIRKLTGRIVVYFQKSDSFSLKYGDKILVGADAVSITNSGNPGAFDYKRYMKLHGLFHQVYVPKNKYVCYGHSPSLFQAFIYDVRDRALKILQENIKGKDNIAVAEALIIGFREELDKDLVQAYSNAGVVHIISISGLHLGLVYILLNWVLSVLPFIKRKKIIQWLLIILALWLFAFVTGCSPSALRSAVMFSFIITGKTFFKQHSTYNALCSSAFILLCIDPGYLWDVGFQLSYVAVFGIVWLQKPIQKLFYFKNKYLQKLWAILSVTIAAQLITSPLCIYYFHQFPNLFLFTNLVAVPASTGILFGGILLFCVAPISSLASITGLCIGYLISFMNTFIVSLNKFPYSVTDHLQLSVLSMWMFYGFIVCTALALLYEQRKMWILSVACFLVFAIDCSLRNISDRRQRKMIVYNIPKISSLHFISGKHAVLFADSSLVMPGILFNFHIQPSEIVNGIESTLKKPFSRNEIYLFNNKLILHINAPLKISKSMRADLVILSNNVRLSVEDIRVFQPSLIIFDASNSLWKIEQWKRACEKLHLPYYSVPSSGAYILDQ